MNNTASVERLLARIKAVSDLDLNLIDPNDENLKSVVAAMMITLSIRHGLMPKELFLGYIGRAFVAGRMRGRKESAMEAMLDEANREEG